ncbi:membrane protein [Paraoerskovia sediminicola]|uniref:Membrane protein n=1 Tax=Paraoerskovia sediminicola TaxID=1138587 RepID=A0ABN6XDM1_9CELL|nr:ABC transporter permease [Paraoerskovia sediminicola]BDZ41865.1 membrane protein [Paraoerskovia sediminicola]
MRAMVLKEFRELRRDKRTLAMLIGLPLMLLIIFGFAANFTVDTLEVAVAGSDADQVEQLVASNPQAEDELDIVATEPGEGEAWARDQLADDHADLAVVTGDGLADDSGGTPLVLIDGSNLFAAQAANVVVAGLGDQVDHEVLYNPDLTTSWVMVPALIGLILTFIGTLITSIGLVRERESGTLEQLAVMPFSSTAVILGKITPYFLLACVDMVIVTVLGMWVFDVPFNGSVVAFVLGAGIFLFAVLGIGVLISTVSQNTGQAVQVAMMTLLPQVLLSGMIFPLDAMAAGVRWIGYLFPLTWFTKISQGVMLRDASWEYLALPLGILVVMACVFFGLAVLRLRRSISPARSHTPQVEGAADGVEAR